MKDHPRPPSRVDPLASEPEQADRLDSWKEIATFLKRDVRTVQRWEKRVGLPVYRHAESRLRTAYAYRSELEAWWRTNRAAADAIADEPEDSAAPLSEPAPASEPEPAAQPEQPEPARRPAYDREPSAAAPWVPARSGARRFAALAAAATAMVTLVVVIALAGKPSLAHVTMPSGTSGSPQLRVVVATFDTRAADASVGRLPDEALERGLLRRGSIALVAPAIRNRILRMMRRAADDDVPVPVAREIALREGRGALVVGGRVQKLTKTYLVNVDAIEPSDGTIRATVEREVASRDELHAAVHAAADEITRTLSSAAPSAGAPAPEALEPVTTASIGALRLYTQAIAAGRRRQWPTSELLARRALAADDQFAAAYAWAAWSMRNEGRPADEVLALAARAVALTPGTTDREVYLVNGTYNTLIGDVPKALAAYEALIRLDPRDSLALDRLIECYARSGRVRQAVEHSIRRADAQPNDFYANVRAAHAVRIWSADGARAQAFIGRSRRLATRETPAERPWWTAWLALLPAFDRWLDDNPDGVLRETDTVAAGLESRVGRERDAFATAVGFSYLSVGRRHQAEAVFRRASMPTRQIDLALSALAVGDTHAAREWLRQIREFSSERPALFARVGLLREAEGGLASLAVTEHADAFAAVTRGLIAYRKRDLDAAAESLRRGIDLLRYSGEPEYFIAVETLARIWMKRGDSERASVLLSDAIGQRGRAYGSPRASGAYCIKLERELAELFTHLGRDAETRALNLQVSRRLQAADRDYPVVHPAEDPEI